MNLHHQPTAVTELAIVVAVARNNVIGLAGEMPWHLQSELNYFKSITTGKAVIMGRKTYESIVARLKKPLPNRTNIIVSNNKNYQPEYADQSVRLCHSIDEAIAIAGSTAMVIGGAQIYQQALPLATKIYRTLVDLEPEGDAWFNLDEQQWRVVADIAKSEGDIQYHCQQLLPLTQ